MSVAKSVRRSGSHSAANILFLQVAMSTPAVFIHAFRRLQNPSKKWSMSFYEVLIISTIRGHLGRLRHLECIIAFGVWIKSIGMTHEVRSRPCDESAGSMSTIDGEMQANLADSPTS